MKKLLLSFVALFVALTIGQAQINENFESGTATLNWAAPNGTWSGVVNNPSKTPANTSNKVGQYIKKDSTAYSLFWHVATTPISLATNNRFSIDVYSKKTGTFIFKLEGPKGNREVSKFIPITNSWVTLDLDLYGGRAIDSLNKLILFFDAGVGNSMKDTFWFDNIRQLPADACSGTVANLNILDNFECQRNADYSNGRDSVTVVNNPSATGINTSAKVGRYGDPTGEWENVLANRPAGFDLRTNNFMRIKIWASKVGRLLMKMEDGAAPKEVWVDITAADLNKWVEKTGDFSDVAFNSYKKAVLFFNGGVLAAPGDVYYYDDWQWTEKPALEDFEPTAKMTWSPLGGNAALHGTYSAVANPTSNAVNNSANVGKFAKGTAAIAVLSGTLPTGFKVDSLVPQINLSVLAPVGAAGKKVRLQLVSATQGNKEAEATVDSAGVWNELKFDFTAAKNIADISTINVLFDPGTAASGAIWHYDNLKQSRLTLNPCVGITPNTLILDDYECQRNTTYGAGLDRLTVVSNPVPSNANTSQSVGRYADPSGEWDALVFTKATALDLSKNNQFSMKIHAPRANTRILFKLEGGTSGPKEIFDTVKTANAWVTYQVDFSRFKTENHKNVAVFFNAGVLNTGNDLYYVDDVQWKSEPIEGCAIDFETAPRTLNFKRFGSDTLDDKNARIIANPSKTGINQSNTVMEFRRLPAGQPWQGGYFDLPAPMKFSGRVTIKAKVRMDHIGNFAAKLEGSPAGPNNVEIPVANTKINEWEEITVDFTSRVTGKEGYTRLTLFVDLGITPNAAIQNTYIDDIVIGDGTCGRVGIFDPIKVAKLDVYPNPVSNTLNVLNTEGVKRLEITNLLGQRVYSVVLNNMDNYTLVLNNLDRGMYIINAFDEKRVIATSKFVKE